MKQMELEKREGSSKSLNYSSESKMSTFSKSRENQEIATENIDLESKKRTAIRPMGKGLNLKKY